MIFFKQVTYFCTEGERRKQEIFHSDKCIFGGKCHCSNVTEEPGIVHLLMQDRYFSIAWSLSLVCSAAEDAEAQNKKTNDKF